MEAELREWFDDDTTRKQLDKLAAEIKRATRSVLVAAEGGSYEQIRAAEGYRRGLIKAWNLLGAGKAKNDEDREAD